jgi:hypothetical protein
MGLDYLVNLRAQDPALGDNGFKYVTPKAANYNNGITVESKSGKFGEWAIVSAGTSHLRLLPDITLDANAKYRLDPQNWTISCWYRLDQVDHSYAWVLANGSSGVSYAISSIEQGTKIWGARIKQTHLVLADKRTPDSARIPVLDNTWYHIGFCFSAKHGLFMFVNGELVDVIDANRVLTLNDFDCGYGQRGFTAYNLGINDPYGGCSFSIDDIVVINGKCVWTKEFKDKLPYTYLSDVLDSKPDYWGSDVEIPSHLSIY